MRNIYFGFSGVLCIMGLILAFENIMIQANGMMIFFDQMTGSLFFPLILIFMIGFASGAFMVMGLKVEKKQSALDYSNDVDI